MLNIKNINNVNNISFTQNACDNPCHCRDDPGGQLLHKIKQFIQSTRNRIFNKTFNDYFVTTNIKFQAAPVGQNDEFLKVVEQIRKVSASIGPSKVSKYHCFNSKLAIFKEL